jgi:hypothetical protein
LKLECHPKPENTTRLKARAVETAESTQRRLHMDTTTLLIIVLIVLLLGGGWYGRGRWY